MTDLVHIEDDGHWLPANHQAVYQEIGGSRYIFEKIASGSTLVEIQRDHGIPAEYVLLWAKQNEEFGLALKTAMEIRETQTAEQIQAAANVFEHMAEEQRKALEAEDLERLALLQNAHAAQRMLMNDKAALLRYIDVKNRADKAARKTFSTFEDVIADISDAPVKRIEGDRHE